MIGAALATATPSNDAWNSADLLLSSIGWSSAVPVP